MGGPARPLWDQARTQLGIRFSNIVWASLERAGSAYNLLDRHFQDGRHHRALDNVMWAVRNQTLRHEFYAGGWGDATVPQVFRDWLQAYGQRVREENFAADFPRPLKGLTQSPPARLGKAWIREVAFDNPCPEIAHLIPEESKRGRALVIQPPDSKLVFINGEQRVPLDPSSPVCIILAGTGEHGYARRAAVLGLPLALEHGVTSIILESPFYGKRKPRHQFGSKLKLVSDLPVLGRATIEETLSMLRWLREERGEARICLAGVSMGGLHSAMTGCLAPIPVSVVSFLGPPSAAPVFAKGLLADACSWSVLQRELEESGDTKNAREAMENFLALTDITNFPKPLAPERGTFVVGGHDLYVPAGIALDRWTKAQSEQWRGSKLLVVSGGHVSNSLFGKAYYRSLVVEALSAGK